MTAKGKIIDVLRKPQRCPICGSRVADIIYGSGDLESWEYTFRYRKDGVMGGNEIPDNPPHWGCMAGCLRFRKVLEDGSPSDKKVKLLKNMRKAPAYLISWESLMASLAIRQGRDHIVHDFRVNVVTNKNEHETLSIAAVSEEDAEDTAMNLVREGYLGLEGFLTLSVEVTPVPVLNAPHL